jgi:mRNA-degrading endonuclease RelE of RelBE toxin-antitoxin system
MTLRVRLDPGFAARELTALPPEVKRRVRGALRQLAADPTGSRHGLDVKELAPTLRASRAFRLRLGDWRVVFLVEARELQVMRIFHRREGYGWLERRP